MKKKYQDYCDALKYKKLVLLFGFPLVGKINCINGSYLQFEIFIFLKHLDLF